MGKKSVDEIQVELMAMGFEAMQEKVLSNPKVIEAYHKRFPTCKHPTVKMYDDGSSLCICPKGAIGESNQQPSCIPWEECFNCSIYEKKKTS